MDGKRTNIIVERSQVPTYDLSRITQAIVSFSAQCWECWEYWEYWEYWEFRLKRYIHFLIHFLWHFNFEIDPVSSRSRAFDLTIIKRCPYFVDKFVNWPFKILSFDVEMSC